MHVNIGSDLRAPSRIGRGHRALADGARVLRPCDGRRDEDGAVRRALRDRARPSAARPVVVRLFDAGGDKPLAWLQAPASAPLARGDRAACSCTTGVLDTQLRAIVRAAEHVQRARPLASRHVRRRRRANPRAQPRKGRGGGDDRDAGGRRTRSKRSLRAADFICIGTNDLFAMRDRAGPRHTRPCRSTRSALRMIEHVVAVGARPCP